jgi:hypothetical protein
VKYFDSNGLLVVRGCNEIQFAAVNYWFRKAAEWANECQRNSCSKGCSNLSSVISNLNIRCFEALRIELDGKVITPCGDGGAGGGKEPGPFDITVYFEGQTADHPKICGCLGSTILHEAAHKPPCNANESDARALEAECSRCPL